MVDIDLNAFLEGVKKYRNEERGFIYDLSLELMERSRKSVGFGLFAHEDRGQYCTDNAVRAVLLIQFGWNAASPKTKTLKHSDVKALMERNRKSLCTLEIAGIVNGYPNAVNPIYPDCKKEINVLYPQFKEVFDQTGAVKALSVLNPKLFVMWDTKIRKMVGQRYGVDVENGEEARHYLNYLDFCKDFLLELAKQENSYGDTSRLPSRIEKETGRPCVSLAKSLDEYFYSVAQEF